MKSHRILRAIKIAALFAAALAVAGFIVMSLWNWLIPALFAGPTLHFWQAIGLLALSRILVGRFGRGGGHRMGWQRMSPEEREKIREHFSGRCGARAAQASEPKA